MSRHQQYAPMDAEEDLIDYTAAELSDDEDATMQDNNDTDDDEPLTTVSASSSLPLRLKKPISHRPLRASAVVFRNDGEIIHRAPIAIRVITPSASGGLKIPVSAIAAAASSSSATQRTPAKRKASPPREMESASKKMKAPPMKREESLGTPAVSARKAARVTGAALVHPSPVPPVGTFVNVSEGMSGVLPEVTQYPYTGHVIRKVGAPPTTAQDLASEKGPTPIIVPSFAAWFDLANVHEIERACLPEFFDAAAQRTKANKFYKDTRNFTIQTFRQNPRVYLTLTAMRKMVNGDACSLQRIHSFLESWGLINYHVDPGSLPSMSSPGSFNSTYPLINHSAYTGFTPIVASRQSTDVLKHLIHHQAHPGGLASLRRSVLVGAGNRLAHDTLQTEFSLRKDPSAGLQCRICKSGSVENVRYVCRQKRDYFICASCFFDGKYPHLLSSADFERYLQDDDANATDAERTGPEEWSREEVYRLLQALSMHEDDWENVADHVRTKNKYECALKFIQLPIEEPFLEQYYNSLQSMPSQPTANSLVPSSSGASSTVSSSAALASIPFAETPNPILSQVAFLASYISPSVGAAGAQAALTYSSIQDLAGQSVKTPFGIGTIVIGKDAEFSHSSFTRADGILTVDLPWGRLYTHATQVSIAPQSPQQQTNEKKEKVWMKDVVSMSGHVLQSAARKSVELAEEEERKVLRLVAQLTNQLMKRIENKLLHLDEIETWMSTHKTVYDAAATASHAERMKQQAAHQAAQAQAAAAAAAAAASSSPMDTDSNPVAMKPHNSIPLPPTHSNISSLPMFQPL